MAEQTEKYREGIDRSLKLSPEEHPERHLTEAEREAGVEEYDDKVSSIEKERGEGKESARPVPTRQGVRASRAGRARLPLTPPSRSTPPRPTPREKVTRMPGSPLKKPHSGSLGKVKASKPSKPRVSRPSKKMPSPGGKRVSQGSPHSVMVSSKMGNGMPNPGVPGQSPPCPK